MSNKFYPENPEMDNLLENFLAAEDAINSEDAPAVDLESFPLLQVHHISVRFHQNHIFHSRTIHPKVPHYYSP